MRKTADSAFALSVFVPLSSSITTESKASQQAGAPLAAALWPAADHTIARGYNSFAAGAPSEAHYESLMVTCQQPALSVVDS